MNIYDFGLKVFVDNNSVWSGITSNLIYARNRNYKINNNYNNFSYYVMKVFVLNTVNNNVWFVLMSDNRSKY